MIISSRDSGRVNEAVENMKLIGSGAKVLGCACDITNEAQCHELARFASEVPLFSPYFPSFSISLLLFLVKVSLCGVFLV